MKNVIFIAPPSAGKGTQSKELINLGYDHISTGDMLREEINMKSDLGLKIEDIMKSGSLVSDDIVFELINKRLKNNSKPFILDGFPRTLNQAKLLDNLFNELNIDNYEVVYLDIAMEEALKRALGRLTCECGASYNIYYEPLKPKCDGVCDVCGKALVRRGDDNEESFRNRFSTFLENNEPIKEFYNSKNRLHVIDATIGNEIVTDKIKNILDI